MLGGETEGERSALLLTYFFLGLEEEAMVGGARVGGCTNLQACDVSRQFEQGPVSFLPFSEHRLPWLRHWLHDTYMRSLSSRFGAAGADNVPVKRFA